MTLSRVVVIPTNVIRLTKYCSPCCIFIVTSTVYVTQHDRNPNIRNYIDALYFTIATLALSVVEPETQRAPRRKACGLGRADASRLALGRRVDS
jgi:hypothetical protein